MPNAKIPVPSAEMHRRLEIADDRSILNTRDHERSVEAACENASKLTAANQQLQAYTGNMKTVFNAQRSMTRELEQVYHDTLRGRWPYKPAFEHASTCDIILNGDGRRRPEHFDPHHLGAFRAIHQEFEAIYC
jgi:hypothetical protein